MKKLLFIILLLFGIIAAGNIAPVKFRELTIVDESGKPVIVLSGKNGEPIISLQNTKYPNRCSEPDLTIKSDGFQFVDEDGKLGFMMLH
jgi:hypothetical protein